MLNGGKPTNTLSRKNVVYLVYLNSNMADRETTVSGLQEMLHESLQYVCIYIYVISQPAMLDHQRVNQGTPGECGSYWGLGPPGSCREFPSFIDQLANIPSWVMLSNLQKENHRPQQIPAVANINQQQKWDVDSPFSSWNATPEMLEGLLHSKSYYRVQKKDGQVVPKMFVDDVPLTQILGFLHVLT